MGTAQGSRVGSPLVRGEDLFYLLVHRNCQHPLLHLLALVFLYMHDGGGHVRGHMIYTEIVVRSCGVSCDGELAVM